MPHLYVCPIYLLSQLLIDLLNTLHQPFTNNSIMAWLVGYTSLLALLITDPILIPESNLKCQLPIRHSFHLVAWNISCNHALQQDIQTTRLVRCSRVSVLPHSNYTKVTGFNLPTGWRDVGLIPKSLYQYIIYEFLIGMFNKIAIQIQQIL